MAYASKDVLRIVFETSKRIFADQGIELPDPVVDGGGPSSTFTAAVFAGTLLDQACWGPHVAVRIPDGAYDLERGGLIGTHLGVFSQVFFSLPGSLMGDRDAEEFTRTLVGGLMEQLLGRREELLFRAYPWNANSTRMIGIAKEVNLASGLLKGMEVAQLNFIEQVGGSKLAEPSYLIVIGADRLGYLLALHDYYENAAQTSGAGGFYRFEEETAQAITELHRGIMFAKQLQPGLEEQLERDLQSLEAELGESRPLREESMASFRDINILLETLFMTRRISGELRQTYIGRIGDLSKLLAQRALEHPDSARSLVQAKGMADFANAVKSSRQMLLASARRAGNPVVDSNVHRDDTPLPTAVKLWHAEHVVAGIDQDLLHVFSDGEKRRLESWIVEHYEEIDDAARNAGNDLPYGFAASKVAEERSILAHDLAMTPDELRRSLADIRLVGSNGAERQERLLALLKILGEHGVEAPGEMRDAISYLGLEQLFLSTRVFERSVPVIINAWFERHLPAVGTAYSVLQQKSAPEEQIERQVWGSLHVETVARHLSARAAANKPLWQDPYGARHTINKRLLPMWAEDEPSHELRGALIDRAVKGLPMPADAPDDALEKVRLYLRKKLLENTSKAA